MWVLLAFLSALFLGFYETAKKQALSNNQVLGVLWCSVAISTLLFLPVILASWCGTHWFAGTMLDISRGTLAQHGLVFLKAVLVLLSWICGYYGLKHLPLTLVAPLDALRPVPVLIGALILFRERPTPMQWLGMLILMGALLLLGRSGRQDGIAFKHNKWVWLVGASTLLAAASGLYDKFLMQRVHSVFVQSWFNVYQLILMSGLCGVLRGRGKLASVPFHWSWAIVAVSVCLSAADFAYFYALRDPDAMISVISMIRRGSVAVAFLCGIFFLREKNWRSKLPALAVILLGLICLWLGSRG